MPTTCFLVEFRPTHQVPNPYCAGVHDPPCIDQLGDIVRLDTGEVVKSDVSHLIDSPPGAMFWWNMTENTRPTGPDDWDHPNFVRPTPDAKRSPSHTFTDGPQLAVILPNGNVWNIDSRASNCTMPYDYAHRCWVRHGEPPVISADKNGLTCAAGAGSILSGDYHGFLTGGVLTP